MSRSIPGERAKDDYGTGGGLSSPTRRGTIGDEGTAGDGLTDAAKGWA